MSIGVPIGKGSSWMVRWGDERKGGGESGMSSMTSSAESCFGIWGMGRLEVEKGDGGVYKISSEKRMIEYGIGEGRFA